MVRYHSVLNAFSISIAFFLFAVAVLHSLSLSVFLCTPFYWHYFVVFDGFRIENTNPVFISICTYGKRVSCVRACARSRFDFIVQKPSKFIHLVAYWFSVQVSRYYQLISHLNRSLDVGIFSSYLCGFSFFLSLCTEPHYWKCYAWVYLNKR